MFAASFAFKAFAETIPAYLQLVFTKQYILFVLVLLGTAPAFLLTYIVYRLIGAPVSDLVFIYFSVLTLWIGVAFATLLGVILFGVIMLPLGIIFWFWPNLITSPTTYLIVMFVIGVLFYSSLSVSYYVPMMLFQKSTGRSSLFASTLCISALGLFVFSSLEAMKVTGTDAYVNHLWPKVPPDLDWCEGRGDATPDQRIAGCTVVIATARYNDELSAAFYNRATVYASEEEYDLAIADYGETIRLRPTAANAFVNRGIAYLNDRQFGRAIADFDETIKLNPKYAEAFQFRGVAHSMEQQQDLAVADLSEAIKLNPTYTEAFYNRGMAYIRKEGFDAAITDFNEAIRLDPARAAAFHWRGIAYYNKKLYDRAMSDFGEAIRLKPEFPLPYFGRGSLYFNEKQYDRAIADYSEAIRLQPPDTDSLAYRGMAYANKGEYAKAVADFSEVIRLDPNNANAYLNRAKVYKAQSCTALSRNDVEIANRLGK